MFKHTLRVQVHCSTYLLNMVNIYLNRLSSFETSLEERRSHHSPPKSLNRLPVLLLHALLCPRCFQCHVSTFALATICSSSQKQRSPLLRHCPFQIKRTTSLIAWMCFKYENETTSLKLTSHLKNVLR